MKQVYGDLRNQLGPMTGHPTSACGLTTGCTAGKTSESRKEQLQRRGGSGGGQHTRAALQGTVVAKSWGYSWGDKLSQHFVFIFFNF